MSCEGSLARSGGALPAPSQLVIVWHVPQSLLPTGGGMNAPPSKPTPATGSAANVAVAAWQDAQVPGMPAGLEGTLAPGGGEPRQEAAADAEGAPPARTGAPPGLGQLARS